MNVMKRLEETWTEVESAKVTLPDVSELTAAEEAYMLTHQSIEQFVALTHQTWFTSIDNTIAKGRMIPESSEKTLQLLLF